MEAGEVGNVVRYEASDSVTQICLQSTYDRYTTKHAKFHVNVFPCTVLVFIIKQAVSKTNSIFYAENPHIYDIIAFCTENEPYSVSCQTTGIRE